MHRGKTAFFTTPPSILSLYLVFFFASTFTRRFCNKFRTAAKKGGSVVFRKFMSVIFHAPRILTRRARSEAPLVTRIHPRRTLQFRLFALRLQ